MHVVHPPWQAGPQHFQFATLDGKRVAGDDVEIRALVAEGRAD